MKQIKITWSRFFLITFILFLLLEFFVWYPMSKIDNERCLEKFYELNISRCDRVSYVPTINPFKFSDKCYCENYDKIYFDLEEENDD